MTVAIPTRELGARGSRGPVAGSDPAASMPPAVGAVLDAVPGWWEARASAAGLTGSWLDVYAALNAEPPAVSLGDGVTEHTRTVVEGLTSATLGSTYVATLSRAVRARHGRHYTPEDLADRLWAMARTALGLPARRSRLPGLVRDRACGAGALLIPPLREHIRACAGTDPQVALAALPNFVEGVDNDPYAVWLANVTLAAEILPLLAAVPKRRRRPLPALARCGDGLRAGMRPARLEIQNPPYGRVRLTEHERSRWQSVLFGHANLYGLFVAAAVEDLDDDGVLAALVPTSFTSGLYFSRLRGVLSSSTALHAATFVTSREGVFSDVLQETCLAVFGRRQRRTTTVAAIGQDIDVIARVPSPRGDRPWLLPRRAEDVEVARVAARSPLRLHDLGYRCSTGPLVWNRRVGDLSRRQRRGSVRVVWAADIDGGTLHRDKARDAMRFVRVSPEERPTLVLCEEAVLVQRTSAPEQPRRLVVSHLSMEALGEWGGAVVVENHVNVLRACVESPLLSASTLAAVLATSTVDRIVRSLSGSVAVSAYELEAIPFPDSDVLRRWDSLRGEDLEEAVAAAYAVGG